jgi:hypothetical protein
MKYILWIVVAASLLMAAVGNDPLWPLVLCAGVIANGLVMGLNGWKMPVRRRIEEGVRHTPMMPSTRLKFLGDIIPTGSGLASVGDFLLFAGALGMMGNRGHLGYAAAIALSAYGLWVVGWSGGFNLRDKWTPEERKDSRKNLPIVMALIIAGNLIGVRGCSLSDLRASATDIKGVIQPQEVPHAAAKPSTKWRDLGKLAQPSFEMLTRLKRDTAKQDQKNKEEAIAEVDVLTFTNNRVIMPKIARH